MTNRFLVAVLASARKDATAEFAAACPAGDNEQLLSELITDYQNEYLAFYRELEGLPPLPSDVVRAAERSARWAKLAAPGADYKAALQLKQEARRLGRAARRKRSIH